MSGKEMQMTVTRSDDAKVIVTRVDDGVDLGITADVEVDGEIRKFNAHVGMTIDQAEKLIDKVKHIISVIKGVKALHRLNGNIIGKGNREN